MCFSWRTQREGNEGNTPFGEGGDNIETDRKRIFSEYGETGNRGIVVIFETEARYLGLH